MAQKIIIDHMTYKIMKYMYGKNGVLFKEIVRKFGEDNACLVFELCRIGYAVHRKPDGSLTQDTSYIYPRSKFALLVPGNKRVESIRESKMIRWTPIFLSGVSVFVSIVALIISLCSMNSEIIVRILN